MVADNTGYLWMFGGLCLLVFICVCMSVSDLFEGDQSYSGGSVLADLWRFNTANNYWTWCVCGFCGVLLDGLCLVRSFSLFCCGFASFFFFPFRCRMNGCTVVNFQGASPLPGARRSHGLSYYNGVILVHACACIFSLFRFFINKSCVRCASCHRRL